jgi:hypothetical protein
MALVSTTPYVPTTNWYDTSPNGVQARQMGWAPPNRDWPPPPTEWSTPGGGVAPTPGPASATTPRLWTLTAGQTKTLAQLATDAGAALESVTITARRGNALLTFGGAAQAIVEGESMTWSAKSAAQPLVANAFAITADAGSEVLIIATT